MIVVEQDVELLLARLESAPPVVETKWGKA
jgi:hypothetical protein